MSEYRAKKKYAEASYAIQYTSRIRLLIGLVTAVAIIICTPLLAKYYFKDDRALAILPAFAVLAFIINLPRILSGLFNAVQQNKFVGLIQFLQKFLFLVFFWGIASLGFKADLVTASWALVGGFFATAVLLFYWAAKHTEMFRYSAKKTPELTANIRSFAWATWLAYMANSLVAYVDTTMLTYMRSLEEVGIYNVVAPTVMVFTAFGSSVNKVFFPMVSELWAKEKKAQLSQGFETVEKYALIVVVPATLVLMVFPEIILQILFTKKFVIGASAMRALSLSIIFLTTFSISSALFNGIGKPEIVKRIVYWAAGFNVFANLVLIYFYGVLGAALSTTGSTFIMFFLGLKNLKKYVEISPKFSQYLKILGASVVFLITAMVLKSVFVFDIYVKLFLIIIISATMYLASCYVLRLISLKEISSLLRLLKKKQVPPPEMDSD